METFIRVSKFIFHKLSLIFLSFLVVSSITLFSFSLNITNRDTVKGWFSQSETYQNVLDEALSLVSGDNGESLSSQFSDIKKIDTDKISQSISDGISASYLQKQTESALDGIYDWLEGKTEIPDFNFSISSRKAAIEKSLTDEMVRQFSKLPACKPGQVPANYQLTDASCIPANVSVKSEVKKLTKDIFQGKDNIFDNIKFSSKDLLNKKNDFHLTNDDLDNIPNNYSAFKTIPTMFIILAIIAGVIAVATAKNWRRGLKQLGAVLFSSSILAFLVSIALGKVRDVDGSIDYGNITPEAQRAIENIGIPFVQEIAVDIARVGLWISGVILFIGAGLFFWGWWMDKHKPLEDKPTTKK